jgi:hypothetical protein
MLLTSSALIAGIVASAQRINLAKSVADGKLRS